MAQLGRDGRTEQTPRQRANRRSWPAFRRSAAESGRDGEAGIEKRRGSLAACAQLRDRRSSDCHVTRSQHNRRPVTRSSRSLRYGKQRAGHAIAAINQPVPSSIRWTCATSVTASRSGAHWKPRSPRSWRVESLEACLSSRALIRSRSTATNVGGRASRSRCTPRPRTCYIAQYAVLGIVIRERGTCGVRIRRISVTRRRG